MNYLKPSTSTVPGVPLAPVPSRADLVRGLCRIFRGFVRSVKFNNQPIQIPIMSARTYVPRANEFVRLRKLPRPAPSLRIPVTRSNRTLLRRMRAAELSAWRNSDSKPRRSFRIRLSHFSTQPLFRPSINRV